MCRGPPPTRGCSGSRPTTIRIFIGCRAPTPFSSDSGRVPKNGHECLRASQGSETIHEPRMTRNRPGSRQRRSPIRWRDAHAHSSAYRDNRRKSVK